MLFELWSRVVDDKCQGDKDKHEEKHVVTRVALHGEVDIKLCRENEENNNKGKNRARPDENEKSKHDKE